MDPISRRIVLAATAGALGSGTALAQAPADPAPQPIRYADVSLSQWMALTPAHLIRQHLNLDDATIAALRRQKDFVVG